MRIPLMLGTLAIVTFGAGSAFAASHSNDGASNSMAGKSGIITNTEGMTLYIFDKDSVGTSNCNGGCAEKWPPVFASKNATTRGDLNLITRADGTRQWAIKGMPLYRWVGDSAPGDTNGDGIKGVWHIAKR